MGKPRQDKVRALRAGPQRLREAMRVRIQQRIELAGTLKIPAVPALLEEYLRASAALFISLGRSLSEEQLEELRQLYSIGLGKAFQGSQRSKVVLEFRAEAGHPLRYSVSTEISPLSAVYERWVGESDPLLFGAHADARVLSLAANLDPGSSQVLDLGAGTGRNALALARLGFAVDAVELTPKFAELLAAQALREALPVRVVLRDVFHVRSELRRDYDLFIASELAPDFRGSAELRRLFELGSEVLKEGGKLVVNLHLAAHGYTPEKAAREFAQQSYSALYTASEIEAAMSGLPFALLSNDSVHDYEREHLPQGSFPPTPWYVNWTSGRDVYELEREECPIELRWLVYQKLGSTSAPIAPPQSPERKTRRFDPGVLRKALVRRLQRRAAASVELTVPAVPGALDLYTGICFGAFRALGREFSSEQAEEGQRLFERALTLAFEQSPRSNVVVTLEVPRGSIGRYTVVPDPVPLSDAYQQWLETLPEPLFGPYPDARLGVLMESVQGPLRVLEIGAGLGRNALPLARAGHSVDAVELSPAFAERLVQAAQHEDLPVRVIVGDVFASRSELGQDYGLILLSGVAADFRSVAELRSVFEIAAHASTASGLLLFNVHLAIDGFQPDAAAREWAQQSCAMFFTRAELARAKSGMPFELVSDDAGYAYEREHSPDDDWPTEAYSEWALGTHIYALSPEESPIELRWLLYKKRAGPLEPASPAADR